MRRTILRWTTVVLVLAGSFRLGWILHGVQNRTMRHRCHVKQRVLSIYMSEALLRSGGSTSAVPDFAVVETMMSGLEQGTKWWECPAGGGTYWYAPRRRVDARVVQTFDVLCLLHPLDVSIDGSGLFVLLPR